MTALFALASLVALASRLARFARFAMFAPAVWPLFSHRRLLNDDLFLNFNRRRLIKLFVLTVGLIAIAIGRRRGCFVLARTTAAASTTTRRKLAARLGV